MDYIPCIYIKIDSKDLIPLVALRFDQLTQHANIVQYDNSLLLLNLMTLLSYQLAFIGLITSFVVFLDLISIKTQLSYFDPHVGLWGNGVLLHQGYSCKTNMWIASEILGPFLW